MSSISHVEFLISGPGTEPTGRTVLVVVKCLLSQELRFSACRDCLFCCRVGG